MPKISLFTKYTSLTIIAILSIAFFSYNLPAKYQLANLINFPASKNAKDTDQISSYQDAMNRVSTGGAVSGETTQEDLSLLEESHPSLYQLLNPNQSQKANLQLGGILLTPRNELFVTPDSITSNSIKWHTIKTEDLETNSITSRTIEDKTIQKEDLSPSLKDQIYATDSEVAAETDPIFIAWNKSTGISITESQITDLKTYLTANQTITLSGDISGTGTTSIATTLPTINSSIGTFNNLTINAKGQVTAGTNVSYLTSYTETDATFSTWLNAGSPSLNTLTLTQITGTAPMQITSTTKVANLNADLLDGFDSSAFGDATAANQTEILTRIGTNADAASMSSTLFAGQHMLSDVLGTNDANNTFDSSSVVENADGSAMERLESLSVQMGMVLTLLAGDNPVLASVAASSISGIDYVEDISNKGTLGQLFRYIIGPSFESYKSLTDLSAITSSSGAMTLIVGNSTAMNTMANSEAAMSSVAASATAMTAVTSSVTAMDAISASSTARTAIGTSGADFDAIAASSMAIGKYAVGCGGISPISYTNMTAVAASSTAMTAVAASSTAMTAVVASSIAMTEVIASSAAMTAVIASSAAVDIVRNNSVAYARFSSPNTIYSTNGTYTFTVPAGKYSVTAIIVGQGGVGTNATPTPTNPMPGGTRALGGGFAQAAYAVTPGQTFTVTVGATCSFNTISVGAGAGKPAQSGKLLKLDGATGAGGWGGGYGSYANGGNQGADYYYGNTGGYGGGGGYSPGGNGGDQPVGQGATTTGALGVGGTGAVLLVY